MKEKARRLLFLYFLNVEIAEPYKFCISELLKFFDIDREGLQIKKERKIFETIGMPWDRVVDSYYDSGEYCFSLTEFNSIFIFPKRYRNTLVILGAKYEYMLMGIRGELYKILDPMEAEPVLRDLEEAVLERYKLKKDIHLFIKS